MSDKNDFQFGKMVENFIGTAKNITENIVQKGEEFIKDSGIQELKDYYPFYSWPPLNLYVSEDSCLIFEFGLSGFIRSDITIGFEDDYMVINAKLSNLYSTGSNERTFKNKLKLKDIVNQKYFVPEDKFDRKKYSVHMKNGLMRIVFSPIPGSELVFN
ncbi:MAG: hypothetical protein OCD02_19155 [Spirochaetaceae bacterium]